MTQIEAHHLIGLKWLGLAACLVLTFYLWWVLLFSPLFGRGFGLEEVLLGWIIPVALTVGCTLA